MMVTTAKVVQMAVAERYEAALELKAAGHSQRQIAAAIGVNRETVRKDLTGRNPPRKEIRGNENRSKGGRIPPAAPLDTVAALTATTAVQQAAVATETREARA